MTSSDQAKKFFTWLDGEQKRLSETDDGKKLVAAGYSIWYGGGGMLMWSKAITSDWSLLVSAGDVENGDLSNPEKKDPDDVWVVSVTNSEDSELDPSWGLDEFDTVEEVIERGEKLAKHVREVGVDTPPES